MTDTVRRTAFIQSLCDCADFLERHQAVKAPQYVTMNVFVNTREEVAAHAKAASWKKVHSDDWFWLHREFGEDLSLDITASRETVCRRVVTGTRTIPARPEETVEEVEWVCDDAVLAPREESHENHP
jgi:hypothetical protein